MGIFTITDSLRNAHLAGADREGVDAARLPRRSAGPMRPPHGTTTERPATGSTPSPPSAMSYRTAMPSGARPGKTRTGFAATAGEDDRLAHRPECHARHRSAPPSPACPTRSARTHRHPPAEGPRLNEKNFSSEHRILPSGAVRRGRFLFLRRDGGGCSGRVAVGGSGVVGGGADDGLGSGLVECGGG